jgi:hypothetical protein
MKMWARFNCALVRACSEHSNARSDSVKGGHIYVQVSHYQLSKEDFVT